MLRESSARLASVCWPWASVSFTPPVKMCRKRTAMPMCRRSPTRLKKGDAASAKAQVDGVAKKIAKMEEVMNVCNLRERRAGCRQDSRQDRSRRHRAEAPHAEPKSSAGRRRGESGGTGGHGLCDRSGGRCHHRQAQGEARAEIDTAKLGDLGRGEFVPEPTIWPGPPGTRTPGRSRRLPTSSTSFRTSCHDAFRE